MVVTSNTLGNLFYHKDTGADRHHSGILFSQLELGAYLVASRVTPVLGPLLPSSQQPGHDDRWSLDYCGDSFVIYKNNESLCCTPETNVILI